MANYTAHVTINNDVAPGSAFQTAALAGVGHRIISNAYGLILDGAGVAFAFGASLVTITNNTASTFVRLTSFVVEIEGPLVDGDTGPQGPAGANGRNPELSVNSTHIRWRLVGDPTWIDLVPLDALQGAAGAAGNTILNGTAPPSGGTGVNGDFFLDRNANRLYGPKTAGAWGAGVALAGVDSVTLNAAVAAEVEDQVGAIVAAIEAAVGPQ
jgi:hypothetical protein